MNELMVVVCFLLCILVVITTVYSELSIAHSSWNTAMLPLIVNYWQRVVVVGGCLN